MTIWIVLVNDRIHAAFDTPEAAAHHSKQMNLKWNITEIIEVEVQKL